MANENDLTITLSLDDKATGPGNAALKGLGDNAKKASQDASEAFEKMGKSLQSVGREIGHVSTTLAFLGGGIVAPFALALNTASKSSVEVSESLGRLSAVTEEFQNKLAQAVLPVVNKLTHQLNELMDAFDALPKGLKDSVLQTTLLTGEFLLATAAVGLLAKEIIALVANVEILIGKYLALSAAQQAAVLTNLSIVAGIGVLIALMLRFKGVADTVISTFEVLFRYLVTGFDTIKLAILGLEQVVVDSLEGILTALAKIPGPQQRAFEGMKQSVDNVRLTMQAMAQKEMGDIVLQSNKIGSIFKTGQGEWSQTFDKVKTSAQQFFNSHKADSDKMVQDTRNAQKELVTLSNQLRDLNIGNSNKAYLNEKMQLNDSINMAKFYQQNWMQAHQSISSYAIASANTIKQQLGDAISGIITGTMTAKEAFTALGQEMIKMIVDYFVQKGISMALDWAFGKSLLAATVATQVAAGAAIAAAFGPAALFASIATFGAADAAAAAGFGVAAAAQTAAAASVMGVGAAHLSEGTDTVPAMLTPGEMVFPKSMSDAIRSGKLSVSGPGGRGGGGDVNIYMSGVTINSKDSVRQLAEELGFEIERRSRNARSNI